MKNKRYMEYIGLFLVTALPKIVLAMQTIPLKTFSDELATMASAAALAGYDWSAVVSQAGYYGAGFYCLFAPVFILTDNPVIIYRTILIGCSFVQAFIAPISYYILNHYLHVKDKKYAALIAFASAFLVVTRTSIVFNEHILILLVWLVVLILGKLYEYRDDKGKKRIYTMVLMLIFSYSMTIHTRMLTFWIAIVLLLIVYGIVEKRIFVSKSIFVLVGASSYWVAQKAVAYVQSVLWSTENGSAIRNASIEITTAYDYLSPRTWKAWISIIVGQVETVNLVTGGVAILLLSAVGVYLLGWIRRRKTKSETNEDMYYLIILFFTICCAGMTIAALSLSWLGGAAAGISHGYNSEDYGLKAYTYLRYFALYIGPIFMCGMALLKQYEDESKRIVLIATPISMFFFVAWMVLIQPFVFENRNTFEFFSGLSFFWTTDKVELSHYLIGMVYMLVIGILIYTLLWEQKYIQIAGILSFYLLVQFYANGITFDVNRTSKNMLHVDGGYEVVQEMEEILEVPKKLYFYDGGEKEDHFHFYIYQFYLNRYEIQPLTPANLEEAPKGQIIFSNMKEDVTLLDKGYTCYVVDSNEYVYVDEQHSDIQEYFENRN